MSNIHQNLKEEAFEKYIEEQLVKLHNYRSRNRDEHYQKEYALDTELLFEFLHITQKEKIDKLHELYGESLHDRLVRRIDSEISSRGLLDVLRKGVEEGPVRLDLIYFKPVTKLNPESQQLYKNNIYSVIRQVKFSLRSEQSVDLVLFINGIPIVTAELKNELTGQTVANARRQYVTDRNPKEKLFSFKRCVAHFAVDTSEVYLTSQIKEDKTYFLPFNKGFQHGAGNPPTSKKQKTYYLWEEIWDPNNLSNILQSFAHNYIEIREDRFGKEYKVPVQIFPRYHQWRTVEDILHDTKESKTNRNFLIQHSAGSGKSMTIAWLAYRLSNLHTSDNDKIYHTVIVLTDRRILDKQLRDTIRAFEPTHGIFVAAGENGVRLKDALSGDAKIVSTTIQKFPYVDQEIKSLSHKKFALIVDEAHSSQSGELTKDLHGKLTSELDENWLMKQLKNRQQPPNLCYFAFTATPKHETFERFGARQSDGSYVPFSLYSMKQAIDEGFILDVLTNYTKYKTYFKLIKSAENDPSVPRNRALSTIFRYVNLHNINLDQKIEVMVSHFDTTVRNMLNGEAKAMIVTSSREAAVRYKLRLDKYLREHGYQYKSLVAFTDSIKIDEEVYTEVSMNNGVSEDNTTKEFKKPEYRFLIVAEKYQTGFDEPFLCAMYVDRKLSGVQAVQTLSRLNRTAREKDKVFVLDFVNEANDIQNAFEPYYTSTIISEGTDINTLNDLRGQINNIFSISESLIDGFIKLIDPEANEIHPQANSYLDGIVIEVQKLDERVYRHLLSLISVYLKRYPFIAQILCYSDITHEKLYIFLKYLYKKLPKIIKNPPIEILDLIDLDTVRVVRKYRFKPQFEIKPGDVVQKPELPEEPKDELEELLSKILEDANQQWGTEFGKEQQETLNKMTQDLVSNNELQEVIHNNTSKQSSELVFDGVFKEKVNDQFDNDQKLWETLMKNEELLKYVKRNMFRYVFNKVLRIRE